MGSGLAFHVKPERVGLGLVEEERMTTRCTKQELGLVTFALIMGMWLRFAHSDRLAVEHFDEGVYASAMWYDAMFEQSYPMRHLYAPPLLPTLIAAVAAIPGCERIAPFLPSMLLGSATLLIVWWMARAMFGQAAGLFAAFVASFSDFHTLYSRMALTDVPVLCLICGSVLLGVKAVADGSLRRMAAGGFVCGLAWWTKYSGWLPIAILTSGTACWWLMGQWKKRRVPSLVELIRLHAVFIGVAILVWSPWLWMLQSEGGYAAVQANHAGYFKGVAGWQNRLADHLTYYLSMEGWFGAAAIGIGILSAGTRRWMELRRSTWNPSADASGQSAFPAVDLLQRTVVAAIALFVVGVTVGPLAMLICLAIGGLVGRFLWPVDTELYDRAQAGDTSPVVAGGAGFTPADFAAAPTIDPLLSSSVVLAWFVGMLVMTPMYSPYPRLSLPLLASVWLAAGAGVAWWIEGVLNVDRRGDKVTLGRSARLMRRATLIGVGLAIGLTVVQGLNLTPSRVWAPRTSLRDAARELATTVLAEAAGTLELPEPELPMDEDGMIVPWPESDATGTDGDIPTVWDQVVAPQPVDERLADLSRPEVGIYVMGEPALLKHLHDAGMLATPVQDFNLTPFRIRGTAIPTYLVLGPNALQQDGIFDHWASRMALYEHITDIHFVVSDVILYNLFSPGWIAQQPEARVQNFELYRLKP